MSPSAPQPASTASSTSLRVARLGAFRLECGAVLDELEVGYRTWGDTSRRAVLVCHALTGSADADLWWEQLLGADRALDPESEFVVCSNVLGGCYGTTGPSTTASHLGRAWGPDFPEISVRDMVRAQARLLDHLGVEQLDLVVGGSMGGMQALEWACIFPERVQAMALVATSAAHSAWCIGTSEAQRHAIRSDPAWRGGHYGRGAGPEAGLGVARMIAMQSYRSWESFQERFGRGTQSASEEAGFLVEGYLHHHAEKLVGRFDANSYLTLTSAMDRHDVGRDRGGVAQALAQIEASCLVVGLTSDGLYPLAEQRELAEGIPGARLEIIDAPHGHDGFLIETRQLGQMLRAFRADLEGQERPLAHSPGTLRRSDAGQEGTDASPCA